MFKGELWKNFCNYFKPFGRFNCFNKILPLVIPNIKVDLQIIKRRITEKKTAFCKEENNEYEVENIVLRRIKLCISFINKIVGRVSANHREIKKVHKQASHLQSDCK